jgi:hypothetical protein
MSFSLEERHSFTRTGWTDKQLSSFKWRDLDLCIIKNHSDIVLASVSNLFVRREGTVITA